MTTDDKIGFQPARLSWNSSYARSGHADIAIRPAPPLQRGSTAFYVTRHCNLSPCPAPSASNGWLLRHGVPARTRTDQHHTTVCAVHVPAGLSSGRAGRPAYRQAPVRVFTACLYTCRHKGVCWPPSISCSVGADATAPASCPRSSGYCNGCGFRISVRCCFFEWQMSISTRASSPFSRASSVVIGWSRQPCRWSSACNSTLPTSASAPDDAFFFPSHHDGPWFKVASTASSACCCFNGISLRRSRQGSPAP